MPVNNPEFINKKNYRFPIGYKHTKTKILSSKSKVTNKLTGYINNIIINLNLYCII